MNNALLQSFRNPGPEWRGKPFWSWNGLLEKDELLRQIDVIRDMGFGGFFMHSRTGLATEYLGDEWFDLINTCADVAEKMGLEAWLYDEDRWPSGTAGGKVTENPRFRMKYLRCRRVEPAAFKWTGGLVGAWICTLDGVTCTDLVRLQPGETPEEPEGKTILVFSTEEMVCSSTYNGTAYLDTMNREAVEAFIQSTYVAYKERCGDRIGGSILGIFTDEPHRGALMDGFSLPNEEPDWLGPWTFTLFDDFKSRFGYNLMDRLPELFLQVDGQAVSQVKWHYTELLLELFLENWAMPLDHWCRENKMIMTGHVLHEDSLTAQTSMCGSMMRYYEHMEWPGIDLLTEGNRNYWVAKQLQSAARQIGRKWLLSELYGCTGWQMPLEGHKAVGDWQALFGINVRCPHLSWYTMEGESKRDYPASIFHQSAWWRDYPYVETYFARMGALLSTGTPRCDLLVVNPVESVWCQIYAGWSWYLGPKSPGVQALERHYAELFHMLAGSQLDFDYGDEEMMGRLGKVEHGPGGPVLRVGEAAYRCVVVSGMTTIRSSTLALLDHFINAGGKVIVAGEAPAYVDALPSGQAVALAKSAVPVPFEKAALAAACEEAAGRPVKLTGPDGGPVADVFAQVRDTDDGHVVALLNVNPKEARPGIRVQLALSGHVEEWDCATGERYAVEAGSDESGLVFTVDFQPSGEKLYMVTTVRDESLSPRPVWLADDSRTIEGPYAYELDEPNVCVLDFASHRIGDGSWQPEREILKADQAIRTTLGVPHRGGEMLQPWFTKGKQKSLGPVALRFVFHVDVLPAAPVELVMERPEHFEVWVNGTKLSTPENPDWWVDKVFKRIPLDLALLQKGENTVEIRTDFNEGVNLEALYLLGAFGVTLDGNRRTLTALPGAITAGDLVPQGLPFYSGIVRYQVTIPPVPANHRAFIETPSFEAALVKVTADGKQSQPIAWQPYETDITKLAGEGKVWIEAVLTRRNTFGPLHQVPLVTVGYGPGNFIGEGPNFSENYMLFPAGLLEAPRLSFRRQG
jgi:hypothetical protein